MASELVERLRDYNEGRNWPLLSAAARRIEALEAALKPFADASEGLEPSDYDARIVAWIGNAEPNNGGAYGLHASDFRRAAKLLAPASPTQENA